jgi:hypothetical protein
MDKFDGNFRLVGLCDITALTAKVSALTDSDWNQVSWRQERFEIHRYTQTIELIFDQDFRHENPTKRDSYFRLDCEKLLAPIEKTISGYFTGSGYVVRALLVNLKPQGKIRAHVDTGFSLMNSCRVHIPVTTNDRVVFSVGDETRAMKGGEMWEVNNARTHSVENLGETDRVHLIIDWIPT